jgi:hypothetical protein
MVRSGSRLNSVERPNKRLEPTRLAPPVYSCVTRRAAQAQRWAANLGSD